MQRLKPYLLEYLLIAATALVSVLGFWEIYFGEKADPDPFHHLHVATNAIWLGLLLYQLRLIGNRRFGAHRRAGLAILGIAPLLVATTALLTVRSAHKAIASGGGDFLIIQNVGVTLEVAVLIVLAFVLRKRRKLHGAFLLSTCIMFMGIALFFTLISFVPQFRIEGPETFHRFGTAAMTGQAICFAVAVVFVTKDFRNGWPMMLAAVFFLLNEAVRSLLDEHDLIEPLTAFVGLLDQPLTFVGSFVLLLGLLAATGVTSGKGGGGRPDTDTGSPAPHPSSSMPVAPLVFALIALLPMAACKERSGTAGAGAPPTDRAATTAAAEWEVDFLDDFDRFDPANWQDQRIWVNDEQQCYVPANRHDTREVREGTLRIRVVDLGAPVECDVPDKMGKQHPPTRWVAGRITTKNRREFVKGRWTARLRVQGSGQPGMFPAWWLLGARNNEPPVQEADETVCWPMTGSGEIDIFEHHSDGGPDHYAARAIKSDGTCGGGDWQALMHVQAAPLAEWHDYAVEWDGSDLRFLLDGREIHRSAGQGDQFPEPMFAVLNFAKINPAPMTVPAWTMEVDWVKHERRRR